MARWLPTRKAGSSTHEGVLMAAGLITGEAIFSLCLGVAILLGARLPDSQTPARLDACCGVAILVVILALIWLSR